MVVLSRAFEVKRDLGVAEVSGREVQFIINPRHGQGFLLDIQWEFSSCSHHCPFTKPQSEQNIRDNHWVLLRLFASISVIDRTNQGPSFLFYPFPHCSNSLSNHPLTDGGCSLNHAFKDKNPEAGIRKMDLIKCSHESLSKNTGP